ncbi:hypothetical protein ABZT02_07660 [Streptomyces sp. NPDC005402]|uniref:hypothetical protein n=1 Tax=Streptomyces sp. NPDC005402 TaxID=3155338 RepID=UPI0033A1EBAF
MSSTVDNQSDKRKETRDVLLDAIRTEVENIDQREHQVNRVGMLNELAKAYALVYHGTTIATPPKS